MITELSNKPGFYRVSMTEQRIAQLVGVPGIKWDLDEDLCIKATHATMPRNALALLDDPEAIKILEAAKQPGDWEAREAHWAQLGVKPRTTQHQAIDFIEGRRGTLLADDMRVGKGHPLWTRVLTPDGWITIGALQVGSAIFGSDGRQHRVTGIFDRGRLPVYRVRFSDGASVLVDGDHLWQAWDHNAWARGGAPQIRSTDVLLADLTYTNGNRKWRIPMVQPIEFPPCELPIDPYVLGVLLGDGSFCGSSVVFTPGDELVPKEVERRLPSDVRLVADARDDRATTWRISRRSVQNSVRAVLNTLELWGLSSADKFVPDVFLFASIEQRLALLRGLMDTDGEFCDGHVAFSSASRALVDAVRFLVESMGGCAREPKPREAPRYTYRNEKRIGLPSFRLNISMPEGISPFLTRQGYQPHSKYFPSRTIAAIEPAGVEHVRCISVDAPDRLYVTEHCIVTHNTGSCVGAHDPARGPLVVVGPLPSRAVWLGWFKRLFPGVPVGVAIGRSFDTQVMHQPIVFAHYDVIQHWRAMFKIGTLVFDEAHALSNPRAKRTEAAVVLQAYAECVVAATGTPIWNRPATMHSILGLVAPGAWGSEYDFANRYGAPVTSAYGTKYEGISNAEELHARLGDVMIRRRWQDVNQDIPPISRSVIVAEVTEAERKRLDILAGKLKGERSNTAANLAAYRRQITKLKTVVTVAEAQKIVSRGEPVVVWTWHRDFAELLADRLGTPYVIHGEINTNERERRMQAWKDSLVPMPLVATMAVGQVAIDLSHARFAIFAEVDYIPAVIAQAEMRTFEASRAMFITFVIANHIVDQRLVRALVAKLASADPLGVAAARDSIDALREALMGPEDPGDLDRLLEDLIASAA
jgi:hypothetical protein